MKYIVAIVVFLLVAGGSYLFIVKSGNMSLPLTTRDRLETSDQSSSLVSEVAKNLDTPWAIAFLPDGSMLVTERPGRVRLIDKSGVLQQNAVATVGAVKEYGEGGLMGIAIHPEFSRNKYVYLYYTYSSNGNNTLNRVVRMIYDNKQLRDEKVIIDAIPGAIFHNGGRIKFGPDKYLYVTTGDARDDSIAQNTSSLAGKILKVTDDGKPAPGNPFNSPVYSYGHRNPQGIAWDRGGFLWSTEHGRSLPSGFDELNFVEKGKNYGWPVIQGDESGRGMETPKRNSGENTTWAPSGAVFIGNSLFFAGLKGEALYEAVIEGNRVIDLKEHLKGQFGRLREVVVGPDAMLYVTTSNQDGRGNPAENDDRVLRIDAEKL